MTQTQNYQVQPSGKIKGGSASYTVDLITGEISYQASVVAGFWFFTKTFPFNGNYKVDPNDLLSSKLNAVGNTLTIGNVTFTVTAINGTQVTVSVVVQGESMSGTGIVDASQQYIQVVSLNANGTVSGYSVNIILTEVG